MSLESLDTIDSMGLEIGSNCVVLSIIDYWEWDDDGEHDHLVALQEKLNVYLGFIQDGQLMEVYPKAVGRNPVVELVSKYVLSNAGEALMQKAREVASSANIEIRWRVA